MWVEAPPITPGLQVQSFTPGLSPPFLVILPFDKEKDAYAILNTTESIQHNDYGHLKVLHAEIQAQNS